MQSAPNADDSLALDTQRPSSSHRALLRENDQDSGGSSDEASAADVVDDSHSIVSPSLGRQQTLLASPNASTAQKVAALNSDSIAAPDEHGLGETQPGQDDDARPQTQVSRVDYASGRNEPPRTRPAGSKDETSIAASLSRLLPGRPRSSTASSPTREDHQPVKFGPFSLALPKGSGGSRLSFPNLNAWLPTFGTGTEPQREQAFHDGTGPSSLSTRRKNASSSQSTAATSPDSSTSPALLRRSTSDTSLYLMHSLSRASSLGDDERFANVQAQVNSRFKAIKDSFADSNIRIPRIPPFPRSLVPPWADGDHSQSSIALPRVPYPRKTSEYSKRTAQSIESPPPGMTKANAETHPQFANALKHLKGDVVVMGGYRGSVLRSAEPPYRQLWVPIKVGLNLRKVNLEMGLDPEDEARCEETIIPSGMLKHIGPVDISKRLFKRLRSSKHAVDGNLRVWDYGYDWRLSPHISSKKLIDFLERLDCNRPGAPKERRGATIIAHSLGGLITRHAINARPELFAGVVYAGVPQTCVNILGPLRNGDDVLLSSRVLTAQVNFSIRTSFALLPLDGKCFIDKDTKEPYDVDFFDAKTWDEYRLSPCVARPLPSEAQSSRHNSLRNSLASVLPSIPGRRSRSNTSSGLGPMTTSQPHAGDLHRLKEKSKRVAEQDDPAQDRAFAPLMESSKTPPHHGQDAEAGVATAVSIAKKDAMEYLSRTLADIKRFKEELAYNASHGEAQRYPPAAIIYGKSVPTVYGAFVRGRHGIKCADAYDDLAFASGDGVVLARAAQLPQGYQVAKGGVVSSERGHVALLGDLEAVGRCLNAIAAERLRREHRERQPDAEHESGPRN